MALEFISRIKKENYSSTDHFLPLVLTEKQQQTDVLHEIASVNRKLYLVEEDCANTTKESSALQASM